MRFDRGYAGRCLFVFIALAVSLSAATFGTVTAITGGVTDIVLDAGRGRLYLVGVPDKVIVYSIAQRRELAQIRTDALPLAAAISRDGRRLYVAAHNASSLNIIDLESLAVTGRISLPARPEGVAVGADERVLISTIGTGQNNATNILLLYDPAAQANVSLSAVQITPPAPTPPQLPAPQGQPFRQNRGFLAASADGFRIAGVNVPNANSRAVFVYEVGSSAVLRSRTVGALSSVLAMAPDGRRFMAGLTLFDTDTLEVLAQQNLANAPYVIPTNTNFNTQQNQGGSVFSPDSATVYSAFNVAPQVVPAVRANVSQMMISDADNLLIRTGLQLPENLSGKIVITPDGGTMFAISESGFVTIPIGTLSQQPLAGVSAMAVLLANDQCGVVAEQRSAVVAVRNEGRGALGATTATLMTTTGAVPGLGGGGGAGGGVVVIPGPGGGTITVPIGGLPGTVPGGTTNAASNAPQLRQQPSPAGSDLTYTFNAANRNTGGTVSPYHDYIVSSSGAVNITPRVRVFQNNRDSDARGELVPVATAISPNEALTDLVYDAARQRLYLSNSGMNRVEVYDIRQRRMMEPIKAGQLPRSMAMSLDGSQLLVANSGGESVTVVDLDRRTTGRVRFPPIPFNANVAVVTPSIVVYAMNGPLVLMNNGTLWRVIGNDLVPRALEPEIFGNATAIPGPRSMAVTPGGEYAIIFSAANGMAYLYSALDDRFIQSRQIFTQQELTGYVGAISAGARGTYYAINGTVLNSSLTPVALQATTLSPAVTTFGATSFARLIQPARANATAVPTDPGSVEIVDAQSGFVTRRVSVLEGPVTLPNGNQRIAVDPRTMAIDASGTSAYLITASGLSIIPLDTPPLTDRPVPNQGGIVSAASYVPSFGPGAWISIFGRNLGNATVSGSSPFPTSLGGVCVTLNNQAIPLSLTSTGQINALIPSEIVTGRSYPLVVRNLDKRVSGVAQNIRIDRSAPAVIVNPETKQPAVFNAITGEMIGKNNPATRDRWLSIYGTGFGTDVDKFTLDTDVEAIRSKVDVFLGNPAMKEAEMDVRWAGLVPGFVGLYQINIYVPYYRIRGEEVPLLVRIGGNSGISSQTTGPLVPKIPVE